MFNSEISIPVCTVHSLNRRNNKRHFWGLFWLIRELFYNAIKRLNIRNSKQRFGTCLNCRLTISLLHVLSGWIVLLAALLNPFFQTNPIYFFVGTLLYASQLFQQSVPPVMAFHLGSLGFLTPFRFDNFQEQVNNVLEGILYLKPAITEW